LRDLAVDHAVAEFLLVVVVRGLDTFGEHEAKVVLRQVIRFDCRRSLGRVFDDREPRSKILGLFRNMKIARVKGKRREIRQMLAEQSRRLLEKYREGRAAGETCPLRQALSNPVSPDGD
jgi:hypothetical protein